MKLELEAIRHESNQTVSFLFRPLEPISWKAGQSLRLVLPSGPSDPVAEGFFPIASAPHENTILLAAHFSARCNLYERTLLSLKTGSLVDADEIGGEFVIEGTGIDHSLLSLRNQSTGPDPGFC